MKYNCPLCGQPVSASLYKKITGIMEERKKALAKIKEQRTKLQEKIAGQRKKLKDQRAEFREKKNQLVKEAVDKQTKRLKSTIATLNRKQEEVNRRADEKMRTATERAHREAERRATKQLDSYKKEIRDSVRDQLKKQREQIKQQVETKAETKYANVKQKLDKAKLKLTSALDRAQVKDRRLQELRDDIKELKEQLKKGTTPQDEGLLDEKQLTKRLQKEFPEDKVEHHGQGGDVLQYVLHNGEQAGVLVYECKRVKRYSDRFISQTIEAKKKRKADFAILVTKIMKKGTQGFHLEENGVMVVHHLGVLSLATVLRTQIIRIDEMKLGQTQRNKAIKLTLEYLESPEFANSMDAIIQESLILYNELRDEMEKHVAGWKRRYSSYGRIREQASTVKSTTQALLSGEPEYKKLIQTESLPALPELLPPENAKGSPVTDGTSNGRNSEVKNEHAQIHLSMKNHLESMNTV
jgi:hypothetical protein